jgi:hypothetical protein
MILKSETYYFHQIDLTLIFGKDTSHPKEAATPFYCIRAVKKLNRGANTRAMYQTPDEGPEQTYEKAWPSDPGKARDDLKQQLMHALLKSEQPVYDAQNLRNDQEKAEG